MVFNHQGTVWVKDIIEVKKIITKYKNIFKENFKEIDVLDVLAIFRNNGVTNPKMIEEWKNLLI